VCALPSAVLRAALGGLPGREIAAVTSVGRARPGKRSGNDVFGGWVSSADDTRN